MPWFAVSIWRLQNRLTNGQELVHSEALSLLYSNYAFRTIIMGLRRRTGNPVMLPDGH